MSNETLQQILLVFAIAILFSFLVISIQIILFFRKLQEFLRSLEDAKSDVETVIVDGTRKTVNWLRKKIADKT